MPVKQQQMFDEPASDWEEDDAREQLVATVVFARGPEQEFDYLVPDNLRDKVGPGRRVRVPFGRGDRAIQGYCIAVESRQGETRRLKSLSGVVDDRPLLSPAMLRLTKWMAEHYLCGLGQVLETVVPAGVRIQAGTRETVVVSLPKEIAAGLADLQISAKQRSVLQVLAANGAPMTLPELAKQAAAPWRPFRPCAARGCCWPKSRGCGIATWRLPSWPRNRTWI